MPKNIPFFWTKSLDELYQLLETAPTGLSQLEAGNRLQRDGKNQLNHRHSSHWFKILLNQFKNAIVLILVGATLISFYLDNQVDALIILTIILISSLLGFWQEKGASDAVTELLSLVEIRSSVLRNGMFSERPSAELVKGDVIQLSAGDVVPADCAVIETQNLFVDEAALTGESFPVEKCSCIVSEQVPLGQRLNSLWMGTHIQSGSALALIVEIAPDSQFGKLSHRLRGLPPETEFERGVRRFGYLLLEVTLILVLLIFAFNVYLEKSVIDSFLFAMALAVGLTPQLLPAVISVNLAHGARKMADQKVIVKQLTAIENLGCMNVLCADKTGTLTEGSVSVHGVFNLNGKPDVRIERFAYLNAFFETGFNNPIDRALREQLSFEVNGVSRLGEIPYDFHRKRLTMLFSESGQSFLVSKGALLNVIDVCDTVEYPDGSLSPMDEVRERVLKQYASYSAMGLRTLGLAYRRMGQSRSLNGENESQMHFLGFLTFSDPFKSDALETIDGLRNLGIELKVITGDNRLVAETVGRKLGLVDGGILTGPQINAMSETALIQKVSSVSLFAEIEPNQKERIVLSLRKKGYVVGYLGDGINDVSALHAADVGISVDSAADVAKDCAQIVLQEKNLGVLCAGVVEGRHTFANTMKYVFMATSANFGNMFSMAGASLLVPFFPLLPKQILLTNLLTDLPEMTIASDTVDEDMIAKPRRWDIGFIRRFMMVFGLISSIFDYLTFAVLLYLDVAPEQFRTAWFTESVLSAALIVFVVRSRKVFFKSRPSPLLIGMTLLVLLATLIVPYTPFADLIGFVPLNGSLYLVIGVIVVAYLVGTECCKRIFYRFN